MAVGGRIRRLFGVTLPAAAALAILASSASAFTPAQKQEMQRIVQHYRQDLHYPGLVVGVWQEGNGGFTTAVGKADLRTGQPMSTRDHFHIGSETKTMTATLVLKLVQRGRINSTNR